MILQALMAPTALLAEGGGFNPLDLHGIGGVLWTWVIFLVALPFMWKLVLGPVSRALEERDDQAVRAIQAADKASADAEAARAEIEVKLGEARSESARMLQEARERAEARARELEAKAAAERTARLDSALSEIRSEREKALAAIREEVVDLSMSAAGQVLGRNVGSEDDRRLVAELVGSSVASSSASDSTAPGAEADDSGGGADA